MGPVALALVPGAFAMAGFIAETGDVVAGLVGGAVLATAVAIVLDRGRVTGDLPLGTLARIGGVAVLAGAAELPAARDRRGRPRRRRPCRSATRCGRTTRDVALGASLAVPVAIGALARTAEPVRRRTSGVALTIGAAVLVGLGSLVDRRWAPPFVAGAADRRVRRARPGRPRRHGAFADAVMILSGIGLAVSVERGRLDGVLLSSLTMTAGIWLRLADAEVTASEPYLAPVALLLIGAGLRARSTGTSSWIAYGPVVTIFGGAALAERMTGGPGWHAVVAGDGRRARRRGRWPPQAGRSPVPRHRPARDPRRLRDPRHHGRAPHLDLARRRWHRPPRRRRRHGAQGPQPHRDRQAPRRRRRREVRLTH